MKKIPLLIPMFLLITFLNPAGLAVADGEREEERRFKGVELYSWQDDDKNWNFVLMDGTNRLKTEKEVKSSPKIVGVEKLAKAFGKLAVGENVAWVEERVPNFDDPPKDVRHAVIEAAKTARINLY